MVSSRRGKHRAKHWQAKILAKATYEIDGLERLSQTLGKGDFSGPLVEQPRILGAVSFRGSTNPIKALSWLARNEKILKERI